MVSGALKQEAGTLMRTQNVGENQIKPICSFQRIQIFLSENGVHMQANYLFDTNVPIFLVKFLLNNEKHFSTVFSINFFNHLIKTVFIALSDVKHPKDSTHTVIQPEINV